MEQIDFHFGVANRTVYVAKLIKKVQKMGLSVAVWGAGRHPHETRLR